LGLKDTFTGDTLCDESSPIVLETLFIPEPVSFSVAVEPRNRNRIWKSYRRLWSLSEEIRLSRVMTDPETNQTLFLNRVGTRTLKILVDRMSVSLPLKLALGAPQVAYRGKLSAKAVTDIEVKFARQVVAKSIWSRCESTWNNQTRVQDLNLYRNRWWGVIQKEFIKNLSEARV
jgi:elongation factor G